MRWNLFYLEDGIHKMMPQYKDSIKLKIKNKDKEIEKLLEIEVIWKDLLLPGLAPLKTDISPNENSIKTNTQYRLSFQPQIYSKGSEYLEEVISQRLACVEQQNFNCFFFIFQSFPKISRK